MKGWAQDRRMERKKEREEERYLLSKGYTYEFDHEPSGPVTASLVPRKLKRPLAYKRRMA